MSKYTIRHANIDEIDDVMCFIREYWGPTHILGVSEEFMRWQYVYDDEFCFFLAVNNQTGEIDGIVGYIPYSKNSPRDIFGAFWKVKDGTTPGIGLQLKMALARQTNAKSLSAIGLNPKTLELHRRSGSKIGSLKHYYMLSSSKFFSIACIDSIPACHFNENVEQWSLVCTDDFEKIKDAVDIGTKEGRRPYKSLEFITHRYKNHPVYRYLFFYIENSSETRGLFVCRQISVKESHVLRIIDYFGDVEAISHIGCELRNLVNSKYEYIDFYEYGIPDKILVDAGFSVNNLESKNVIPNYFEPFEQKNIQLDFYTNIEGSYYLFKGDGDQDRPNYI